MRAILFLLLFVLFPFSGKSQALYKEVAKINDSVDYYLEIAIFNKEDKKSFNKAIFYTEKAIDFAKNSNLQSKLGDCYLVLGGIYFEIQKIDDAIDNYIRSINSYGKNVPKSNLALAYYNLGKCYIAKNKPELSDIYFKKASLIFQELNFTDAIELINLQKAILLTEKGEKEEASKIFKRIIINSNENEALTETRIEALYQLSLIEFGNKNYNESINLLNKALTLNSNGPKNLNLQKKVLKQISDTYKANTDYEKSYKYLALYATITDSIGNFYSNYVNENAYDKIQFEKQLKTIELLDKEKKSQQKTLRFSKLISILSIALISILSLLSLSLYKNNKIRISTNKLLKEKNKELIKEKEKVEKASKARAEFMATVSHELRTPLNAINGITYLLLQEKPRANQLNYLKSLEFSGNYLLNFINDILEINRLESDKILVEKISFNIHELTTNIRNSFNEFIHENKVNCHLDIDDSIHHYLIGDPTKLSQVIINLMNNAIKFTKNGDVWFTVKKLNESNTNIKLYFEVRDNGIGIPKDKQETIFDSFSQGSVEINRTYGGTGLGLSIVKKILELLGTEVKLESDTDKGTSFRFVVDFEKGKELSEQKIFHANTENQCFKDKSVLLVEDNKINQMITLKMLEKKEVKCTIIDNGEEAIEHLKDHHYDLVLMDVHLPGINGTEATAAIREFDTDTPIIALTAISLNENREMLLSYGMNDVITKPFIPDNFYAVISEYLNIPK
ncbi:ATP-binding protein [Flavobacterium sp. NRK F10]|uniref:tetratricopeptide repeat-containing hybrid sensor histidine kinase/response regulator n=1 Tax=Flavobacterium sp. NRK F10 TaxID=2954931 RepID=UPI0020908BAF|nr:ATP-binding protein [Flavobacterium sp. NRK F10]MCO6175529.1 ATP-binding protein [Flavobacterium sp. NRK F10]